MFEYIYQLQLLSDLVHGVQGEEPRTASPMGLNYLTLNLRYKEELLFSVFRCGMVLFMVKEKRDRHTGMPQNEKGSDLLRLACPWRCCGDFGQHA